MISERMISHSIASSGTKRSLWLMRILKNVREFNNIALDRLAEQATLTPSQPRPPPKPARPCSLAERGCPVAPLETRHGRQRHRAETRLRCLAADVRELAMVEFGLMALAAVFAAVIVVAGSA
jgi:hypothetical protein